jgi:HD-GYP domain-containing protein (c-di-GMP phosphodiesterase class II)
LKQVTSKFRDLLREEDKMFRLGGDEFAVIIKADKKETHSAIQRILKEVSDSRSPRITLSGGITGIEPDENISVDEAVRQADKALYLSKESGKNQVLLYEGGDRKSEYDDLFYRIADSKVIEDIKIKLKEFAAEQITSSHLITKDPYIYKHSMAVSKQAVQLGRILKLSDNRVKSLRFGAILYDIGMIAIPEEILHKNSKLTPDEFEIIKYHPIIVARLIQQFPILRDVLPAVLYHHEWINGHGYPFGLVGDSIPLEARIIAVVDAFHAMHSDRPYRPVLSLEESISEIIKGSGTKYDPQVVEAFLSLMTERKLLA